MDNQTYTIPVDWNTISECIGMEDLFDMMENNQIEFIDGGGRQPDHLHGTQQQLIKFYMELDGPAQSFPENEFIDFIQDYKD